MTGFSRKHQIFFPGLRAWAALFRLPNLLTVPGDPAAGFLIASAIGFGMVLPQAGTDGFPAREYGWSGLAVAVAVTLLIYVFGLVSNDLFDLAEDRSERPQRPLPSGSVSGFAAVLICLISVFIGIGLAGWYDRGMLLVVIGLAGTVFLYNAGIKKVPVIGPLFMGSCRGLSFLTGAAAAGWRGEPVPVLWLPAILLAGYVAGVTGVARHETIATELRFRRWLPALVLYCGFLGIGWAAMAAELAGWYFAFLAGLPASAAAALAGRRLAGRAKPEEIQFAVGQWLRFLLLLQIILASIGWGRLIPPAGIGAVLIFFHYRLARRFYST